MALTYPTTIEARVMLCDAAEVINDKMYILGGGLSVIGAATLPAYHPRLALAITITVPWTDTNRQHNLKIFIEEQDGPRLTLGPNPDDPNAQQEIIGQFTLGRPAHIHPGESQDANFALNIDRQLFTNPATYNVVVEIDDEEKARAPLRVITAGLVLKAG